MRVRWSWVFCLVFLAGMDSGGGARSQAEPVSGRRAFALPVAFEPNRGQADKAVDFLARGMGYTVALSPGAIALSPTQPGRDGPAGEVVRTLLLGSNPAAPAVAGEALQGVSNYLLGRDRRKWITDVPQYRRVEYRGVYPGIDLAVYGDQGRLEYDFIVRPCGSWRAVRLAFDGAREVRLDANGDLVLTTSGGHVRQRKPRIYQIRKGTRREVAGGYTLLGWGGMIPRCHW